MKAFYTVLFALTCHITLFAQQRIDIIDSGSANEDSGYTTKEVDGEERSSALVVIQSTAKLNYSVMGVAIPTEEIKRSIDADGIYVDTLSFYINDFDSRRRLMLFAKGFPSEAIDLNMLPKTTYSYMVIAPSNEEEDVVVEDSESYEGLMAQGKVAYNTNKFDYAEKIFERACQIKEDEEVLAYLALSQYRQANTLNRKYFYPKAIENSEKALKLNNDNYIANAVLGAAICCRTSYKYKPSTLYKGEERIERNRQWKLGHNTACTHLKKAIDLGREHSIKDSTYGIDIYYELAWANYYLNDYVTAKHYFEKVSSANKPNTYSVIEEIDGCIRRKAMYK